MIRAGKPAEYVLASLRRFPSLEPVSAQPVSTKILGLPSRRDLLWQAVTYERDAERVGSKVIVGRDDMGYSGRKLLPQKGSGRARMGDRGNPMRHDGGRAHARPAPGPENMKTGLPHRLYSLAMRTALSLKYREGHLYFVENEMDFANPHELVGEAFFKQHGLLGKSVTFIVDQQRDNLFDATSTFHRADIIPKELVTVQDILKPQRLLMELPAFQYLVSQYPPTESLKPIKSQL